MSDGTQYSSIPEEDLLEDYYDNLHAAYNSMHEAFKTRAAQGLTQDDIAAMLSIDKSLVSRRLNGSENLTLKTLSYMGSAMKCKVLVHYLPYELDSIFDHIQYGNSSWGVSQSLGEEPPHGSNANTTHVLARHNA
jgi:transcriptional regulator with XRE-family HTH domain